MFVYMSLCMVPCSDAIDSAMPPVPIEVLLRVETTSNIRTGSIYSKEFPLFSASLLMFPAIRIRGYFGGHIEHRAQGSILVGLVLV